jgi:protein-L-isoaspartate(D-aspartate) O-methyltransferase
MLADLREHGVNDPRVLAAMARVPRERFVPAELAEHAYQPRPLPIGCGQTISAPTSVATMTEALQLRGTERVLEIGTGCGYAAAVLSCCAAQFVTIGCHQQLARTARDTLAELGYGNVEVRHGNGAHGAPDRAPFDAVSMTAMAPHLPPTLLEQLAPGGAGPGAAGSKCPQGQHHAALAVVCAVRAWFARRRGSGH